VNLDGTVDRLYARPATEFVAARGEAVRELRQAGHRAEAEQIKGLRKPTAAAAAVNRLVRERRGEVEALLAAAKALREAQFGGGDVAVASARERESMERLVKVGGEPVRQSLQAAVVDSEAAQELLAGRLARELEPRGFGTLVTDVPRTGGRPRRPAAGRQARAAEKPGVDRRAREELREAKRALDSAEAAEQQAERTWKKAETDLRRAQEAVAKARAELSRLEAR
jgi:hypothetical protein